jgi:threonine/homoserine/homoserine lactone efflux protein|tara:strand:+ start:52 stop:732 length:681 start_codon:yes stop_codon:yes gene_type:complete
MELSALLTLFMAALVLMIKPGPYMMTFIGLSLEGKWKSMLSFWSGYLVVRTAAYYVLLLTLSMLPAGFGMVFIFIKAIAAIIFISMGFSGLNEHISDYEKASEETQDKLHKLSHFKTVLAGGFLCLSNPYDLVFILVVIPALLGQTVFSVLEITYINITITLADIIVQLSYIIPLMMLRKIVSRPLLRKVKVGTSILLIGIGLYLFSTIFTRGDLTMTNLISEMSS